MKPSSQIQQGIRLARRIWGPLSQVLVKGLTNLMLSYGFSPALGDLRCLDGGWYVTHAGLLRLAQRRRCSGIRTTLQKDLCDPTSGRWVFKATVYKSPRSRGFVGYGDADPSNVSPHLRGCELRIAETRAVNRALRKAYGIGLCSVEELGAYSAPRDAGGESDARARSNGNGSPSNGQPRLRDRLCQIIRQNRLDASQVKQYAADFCGTQQLRDASREVVQDFLQHLAEWAARDLNGLVCHLNRYAPSADSTQEVHS